MGHAYEKRMVRLQAIQDATAGTKGTQVPEPMHRTSREAFVRGFGLSAAAVKQLVDRWEADAAATYDNGFDDGREWAEDQPL
jgi:hypothetical protein